jgi:hypothetical protein
MFDKFRMKIFSLGNVQLMKVGFSIVGAAVIFIRPSLRPPSLKEILLGFMFRGNLQSSAKIEIACSF